MIDNNFLEINIVGIIESLYFIHLSGKNIEDIIYINFLDEDKYNINKLKKNNWELHKLIEEGNNPNEIAKIIRNDEIEKLQEISSQNDFDFNQYIEESLYERCDFINHWNVTLIDYAAFFGSVKCFKYLLINGAKVKNTGQYAIASGNEEIIHLCEQNHSSFEDAYETAIEYHKNDIFKSLYENKIYKIDNLEKLGEKCLLHHNYELFTYLIGEGMKISNSIINEAAKIGNIFLVKYFLKENQLPKDILVFSSRKY